jgi:hypothetical protein
VRDDTRKSILAFTFGNRASDEEEKDEDARGDEGWGSDQLNTE